MSEATEQDWEVADEVAQQILNGVLVHSVVRDAIAAALADELDKFIGELRDRTDEIAGSAVNLQGGNTIWLHTPAQVEAWLVEGHAAWRAGEYRTPDPVALEDLFPPRKDER